MKKLIPRASVAVQAAGAAAFLAGFCMLAGLAWTLLVGGVAVTALGTLREAGRL